MIGMCPEMELSGSDYYIHAVFSHGGINASYLRVSPDSTTAAISQRIMPSSGTIHQAVFLVGSATAVIGTINSFTGYRGYVIGKAPTYTAH